MKKNLCFILITLLMITLSYGCTRKDEIPTVQDTVPTLQEDDEFIRMDRDDPDAWAGELENLRFVSGELYEFGKPKDKYGIDPDFIPSIEGLDTLNISGSAQFSEPQFRELAQALREYANGSSVVIVDLRQESHGFVNGRSVSWYGTHNWANAGRSREEIETDEISRFASTVGTTITAYSRDDDILINETQIEVEKFRSERELVESEGFVYYRLPIKDHTWPAAEMLDEFISFVKETDKAWLHFHCHAGKGRTGILMMVYDMMKNPQVPMEDIVVRQTLLGGSYPLYTEQSDSYKVPLYEEKAAMTPLFYEYVQENYATNFEILWSKWLKGRH